MKVNTALLFLCLGAGLWLAHNDERKRTRRILGLLVVIIAGSTLAEYAFHVNLGIDELLFRDTRTPSLSAYPGRMAVATAICFLVLGLAVTFLGLKKAIALQRALVGACFALSLVALCGYLYGVKSLYAISSFSTVAVHTAAGFFAACLAYFLARPDEGIVSIAARDSNSGFLLRRLIPAIIVVPIIIGWVWFAVQRANLYDTPFGVALLVLGNIACLTVLTILIGRSVNRLEWERSRADEVHFRQSAIVESTDDAIIGTDLSGTVTDWNSGAERLFGYSASEAIGKSVFFLRTPNRSEEGQANLEKVLNGDVVKPYETVMQRKDGTLVDVSLRISPIVDSEGRIVGASGIVRDITEWKQSQNALREGEERFRSLYENSTLGLYRTTPDGKILLANPSLVKMLGFSSFSELAQRNLEEDGFEPGYQRTEFQYRLATEGEVKGLEASWMRTDGKAIFVRESAKAIRDAEGKVAFYEGTVEDITERKRAEEALRQSEEKFLKAFRGSPVAITLSRVKDRRFIEVNDTFERLFGYGREEVIGRTASDLGLWVDASQTEELRKRLLSGQSHRDVELRFRMKNGSVLTCLVAAELIKVANEPCIISVASDITQRKLAEHALRDSEEQFRTLAEAIPQLCWMARGDGHVFWYNQRWYTYTGTTPEQMEGWGWRSVHDPQTLPTVLERWKASISTGEPLDMVFPLRGADGVFRPFLTRVMPIKDSDGRVVRWFGTNTDITELRDAQERLRMGEERLRLAQWAARIGTFDLNLRTGENIWTPETEALYGLPPGGFGGTLTAFENLIHPDDRGRVIELSQEMMRTGQPAEGEWRVVWPDGSAHWIAGRAQVFTDESGEPSRMLGVNIDITERKRAEEALSGMSRKLVEAQEQERARIGRELHDDINQRLALLGLELNQLREKHNDLPSEVRDRMAELQQMTGDLCTGVYDLSHELHFSTLDLLGLPKGISSWCKAFGERHKIEIDFKNGDVPKLPQEISLCLFRVLQEAVHNAAKHSGVKRIEVELAEKLGEIHLIVSDSGRGFDIKAAKQSGGLGLTSMQERVRLVGGTIVINSQSRVGTTIQVCVPFKAEHHFQKAAD